MEMRNRHCRKWYMARNAVKNEKKKREMHTVGHGIWRENWKTRKMRHTNSRIWIWREPEKCGKWDTNTVGLWIWREKWPTRKPRNSHGRTWNMTRNSEKREKWDMYTLGSVYGEKIKKREKWNIDTVGRRTISRTVTNEENETQTM